ncbi:hypothetical protein [Collinsella sp. BIOML-A6]|uniref:phosphorylase family protein n=1 Tax=unclassified Collinsella TaxID=2637548 RepID=UPI00351A7177
MHLEPLPAVCAGQAVLPHDAADAAPADGNTDLPGDALILRDPFRPLLAACAAAAAVAPDIKVLKGRVVSGDQFVSPAEQKERILATFGDLCCEMEGCTIAQAAYLNGVPLVVVRAISDKPCAEGRVVTTTLSRRRPPATSPASPRAWLSFRPCAPGPFFMLGPRRAGPFPKRSVEPKC